MQPKKYFIDLDGTLAEWRTSARYEELFMKGYFRTLRPYQNVLEAVKLLTAQTPNVFVLSVYMTESQYALKEKNEWVSQYLPEIDKAHRLFVPQGVSKPAFVEESIGRISKEFVLLDDYTVNLVQWRDAGGTAVKLRNGINGRNGIWKGSSVSRCAQPDEINRIIRNE